MIKQLMTIDWKLPGKPSLTRVAFELKIDASLIDKEYGFVLIDPDTNTFAFMVEQDAAAKISGVKKNIKGPFSNPRIEPFGLEE